MLTNHNNIQIRRNGAAIFGLMFVLALNGRLNAQPTENEFVPFKAFKERTRAANFGEHLTRPGSRVREAGAFEEMRQHILNMYQGVEVTHSFVMDSSHIDCVPIAQQPTARILGVDSIASPPPPMLPTSSDTGDDLAAPATSFPSQLAPDQPFDEFGNSTACEENTIPMRRVTLDATTQFPTLRQFFEKVPAAPEPARSPDSFGRTVESPRTLAPAADPNAGHRYSYTNQNVNNLGGSSHLNVWSPYVNQALGEVFSLSQQWYVGGSGTSRQTAEVGWQNWPAVTNSQKPRLFIYFTANNYNGIGCYNLECTGFFQTDNRVILGGLLNTSVYGGSQVELVATYQLYQGRWWLSINGIWVGYYPVSVYRGGQMSKYAQAIQFGSESYSTSNQFPPEGSGNPSNLGYGKAAYQSGVMYYNTSASPVGASLTSDQPSIGCYTIWGLSSNASGAYFYEGGPGGHGC